MASSTLTVQVSDNLAEALAPFDGLLSIDEYITEILLRDELGLIGRRLGKISENSDMPDARDLCEQACRLEQVIDAIDSISPRTEFQRLRTEAGDSRQAFAERFGVDVGTVRRWDHGQVPPRDTAIELAKYYGVALDFMLGCSTAACVRCAADAPGNPQRFEVGWDVAGGTELVCPDCLQSDDLNWPSDHASEPETVA